MLFAVVAPISWGPCESPIWQLFEPLISFDFSSAATWTDPRQQQQHWQQQQQHSNSNFSSLSLLSIFHMNAPKLTASRCYKIYACQLTSACGTTRTTRRAEREKLMACVLLSVKCATWRYLIAPQWLQRSRCLGEFKEVINIWKLTYLFKVNFKQII